MRVYFLSYLPAILKLNGMYIGGIDGFERHIELDPADRIFAEIIPDENLQGINFFWTKSSFPLPRPFATSTKWKEISFFISASTP